MKNVHGSCSQIREELLGFDWTAVQRSGATRVLQHLELCESCRQAAMEYELLREAVGEVETEIAPGDGWQSKNWHGATASPRQLISPFRLFAATAASVLVVLGAVNLFLLLDKAPLAGPVQIVPVAKYQGLSGAEVAQDVQAFTKVASGFDHRASWMLVSDNATELGLADTPVATDGQLLLVHLNVSRGETSVSQATLAIVPGQSAQLTIPATHGQKLQYTVQTNMTDPRRLSLSLEIGATATPGLASATLTTNLQLEFGQRTQAGQLQTADGLYELRVGLYSGDMNKSSAGGTRI